MSISKSEEKLIRALKLRKKRQEYKLFVAEGEKLVGDFLNSGLNAKHLFTTSERKSSMEAYRWIGENEMKQISHLSSPSSVLAVFSMPDFQSLKDLKNSCIFAVHQLQDPGNLGTIIRTLDWFGPIPLILLPGTVDPYNTKCVQASMGSIARTPLIEATEEEFEAYTRVNQIQILAAHMHGLPYHKIEKREKICIVIGNEGKGLEQFSLTPDALVSIAPAPQSKAESLNASMAAGILAYECSKDFFA